jgi:PAS domain S-box-containing protein
MAVDSDGDGDGVAPSDLGESAEGDRWRAAFDSLLEELPEPVFAVDTEGTVTHWNQGAEALMDMSADETVGKGAYEVFQTEGETETLAETVARTGEAVREDQFRSSARIADEKGPENYSRAMATPVRGADGEVIGAVELLQDVNEIVRQREALQDLQRQMTETVQTSLGELRRSAADVDDSAAQIKDLTDSQAEKLEAVQSEVSDFSASVEEIASSAEEVSAQSAEAHDLAEASVETATATIERVEGVAESSETVTADVRRLRDHLDEIANFVVVVDDIAEQTNMLALNANIEAARSDGDSDGFAVVADEIKTLADESKEHADEVEAIVEEVREVMSTTTENVVDTNEAIQQVQADLAEVLENQRAILEAVSETGRGIDEIADATDDQASSAEEIASMVDDVADRSATVSDAGDEVAAATATQSEKIAEIDDAVETLEREFQTIIEQSRDE